MHVGVTTTIAAAWIPNLSASCLEIAATIAIVDRIVRREGIQRVRPTTDHALYELSGLLQVVPFAAVIGMSEHGEVLNLNRDSRHRGRSSEKRPRGPLFGGPPLPRSNSGPGLDARRAAASAFRVAERIMVPCRARSSVLSPTGSWTARRSRPPPAARTPTCAPAVR